jgi:hypothetical protein
MKKAHPGYRSWSHPHFLFAGSLTDGHTDAVTPVAPDETILDRMVNAVQKVRERLLRSATALNQSGVFYAVVGGNAVAAWVATVDPSAVRNTQDVDILLRRADLQAAANALQSAGFVHRHSKGIDMFLDGPDASARDAVHVVPAAERIRPEYTHTAPDVTESQHTGQFRLLDLAPLVKMKLTSFRRKDQVHLLDLLAVGLIDASWVPRLPVDLRTRLQQLLDTPED